MKYRFVTNRFGHDMYFVQHEGKGFSLSTDPKDGIVIQGEAEALNEAARLRIASGMDVVVEKIKP